jgi:hypothetical protein
MKYEIVSIRCISNPYLTTYKLRIQGCFLVYSFLNFADILSLIRQHNIPNSALDLDSTSVSMYTEKQLVTVLAFDSVEELLASNPEYFI